MTECEHCRRPFEPRRVGHVFCSGRCRRLADGEVELGDPQLIARLFDPSRDRGERANADDWHPTPEGVLAELDLEDTVARRRQWYRALAEAPAGTVAVIVPTRPLTGRPRGLTYSRTLAASRASASWA